jgi:hypothetical protein
MLGDGSISSSGHPEGPRFLQRDEGSLCIAANKRLPL